jgi:AraC-like DNA-binding protein
MKFLHYDTFCTPRSDRADHWASINHQYFGNLEVDEMDTSTIEAQLDIYNLDALKMYKIDTPSHRVRRIHRARTDSLDDSYKLMLQIRGRARLQIANRAFELRPGDWSLYDPRADYSIHNVDPASLLVVTIPRSRLSGLSVPELHTCEAPAHESAGLNAMLGSVLKSISEQLPTLPDDSGNTISESILGLLTYTLARHQSGSKERMLPQAVFKARVKQYIQEHLTDADLSIDRLAAVMRCSKRYVHLVFEDENLSVDRYIWKSRLEVARCRLASPQQASHTIAQILNACGFKSNAHFCKQFKNEFGCSPSDYRNSARQA